MTFSTSLGLAAGSERTAPWRLPLPLVLAAIFALALLERWLVVSNANVAWLLTVAERMLDGQRIYVDTIETNPPFSIWLYLPAAWLGRVTGLRADVVSDGLVFLGAALSLAGTLQILRRSGTLAPELQARWLVAAAIVLVVLPAAAFGEREHVALIAILPIAAVAASRAGGAVPSRTSVLAAGLCTGLVLMIKPHFALAIGAMAMVAAAKRRDLRLLLAGDSLIGAALAAAYLAATFVMHPEFWSQAMPLNTALYLPVRYSLAGFLTHFLDLEIGFVALLVLSARELRRSEGTLPIVLGAGAVGFFLAVVLQGKGLTYHFYPMLALAVLLPFAGAGTPKRAWSAASLLAIGLACVFWTWFNACYDMRALQAAVGRVARHPTLLALGYDFSAGPPLARALGGTYVGRDASQWMADNAQWLRPLATTPEARAKLDALAQMDRDWFIDDLLARKPDVLLVQTGPEDWTRWARRDSRFAPALAAYERKGSYMSGGFRVAPVLTYDLWVRRSADTPSG